MSQHSSVSLLEDSSPLTEWEFIPTTGTPPTDRQFAASAVLGPHIYAFGGLTKQSTVTRYLSDFHIYDSELRQWTELTPPTPRPSPRHSASMVAHGNRLFLFGGCGEGQVPLADLWIYEIPTTRWSKVKKPSDDTYGNTDARQAPKRVTTTHPNLLRTQTIAPSMASTLKLSPMQPAQKEDWPRARYLHTGVVYNDGMFVYGGWMADWTKGERVWRLDLTTLTWSELEVAKNSPMPDRRFGHISAVWDHTLYVFGGSRSTKLTSELWTFDLVTRRWSQIEGAGPGPRKGMSGSVVESHWFIHGGEQPEEDHKTFMFDFRTATWNSLTFLPTEDGWNPQEGHSCCVVSSEFSHFIYLLFGKQPANYQPTRDGVYSMDCFRPSAHLQIEEDEVALTGLNRVLERRISSLFRPSLANLSEQLNPMRRQYEQEILPALEKQLQKVSAKIGTSLEEGDGELLTPLDELPLLKQIHAGLQRMDNSCSGTDSATLFVSRLCDVFQCSEDDCMRMLRGEPVGDDLLASLKRAAPALQILEIFRTSISNDFVNLSVEKMKDINELGLSQVIRSFTTEAAESAERFKQVAASLSDVSLGFKQRKLLEAQKGTAGVELLQLMAEKMQQVVTVLKSPLLGENISADKLAERLQTQSESIATDVASAKKTIGRHDKILAYLDKVEREKRRVHLESLVQFGEKRDHFVARRSTFFDEIKTFVESKLNSYSELLDEEREAILEAELFKRESEEMLRRVSDMRQLVEGPRLQKLLAQSTLTDVVTPVMEQLVDEQKALLMEVEKSVGVQSLSVVEDIAKDVSRFGFLMHEVRSHFEKLLETRENSAKLTQGQIQAKMDVLAVMIYVDPSGAQAVDETNSASPEELQMHIAQYKGVLSALQEEIGSIKQSLNSLNSLSSFQSNVDLLRHSASNGEFEASSYMHHILQSGFQWTESIESASENQKEIYSEWLNTLTQNSAARLSPVKTTIDNQDVCATARSIRRPRATPTLLPRSSAPRSSSVATTRSISRLDTSQLGQKKVDNSPKPTTTRPSTSRFADTQQRSRASTGLSVRTPVRR